MGDGKLCIPRERGNTFRRMDFPAEWAIFMDFLRRMGDDASRMGDVARRMDDGFRRMGDFLTEWAIQHLHRRMGDVSIFFGNLASAPEETAVAVHSASPNGR